MAWDPSVPPKSCTAVVSGPSSWLRAASPPEDVAYSLGRGRSSGYARLKLAREDPGKLAARPHPGRTPRLADADRRRLEELLMQGSVAHGWRTELWTAARVADLIERYFKESSHPEHVREVL